MPLELWILFGLVAAAALAATVVRLRRKSVREAPASESNVYPLW
jgi:hypothetical protein